MRRDADAEAITISVNNTSATPKPTLIKLAIDKAGEWWNCPEWPAGLTIRFS
jgi:hypothetical protein